MYTRVQHAMAQFVPKIEKLSHIIGTGPILETGFVPFFRNKFPGLNLIFHINPYNPKILMVNSPYSLPYTSYFLSEFNRFPGLSRFSRTLTNPVKKWRARLRSPSHSIHSPKPTPACIIFSKHML